MRQILKKKRKRYWMDPLPCPFLQPSWCETVSKISVYSLLSISHSTLVLPYVQWKLPEVALFWYTKLVMCILCQISKRYLTGFCTPWQHPTWFITDRCTEPITKVKYSSSRLQFGSTTVEKEPGGIKQQHVKYEMQFLNLVKQVIK